MKKFNLSKNDKKVFGVCGGIAKMFDIDPTLVRICAVFAALATGILPFVLTYIIAKLIAPEEPL